MAKKGRRGRWQRQSLRGMGLSPTFQGFVEPAGMDNRRRPTYVVLDIYPVAENYQFSAPMFTVPLRIGTMSGKAANNLTAAEIRDIAKLKGLKVAKIRGVARLKPDRERKGRRFGKRAAKRNRRNR